MMPTLLLASTPLITSPVAVFFVVMAIVLLAPLIFNRLKVPDIIGLIIAGVAVGPYGFNIIARDNAIDMLGQVGILFLMFLAGLEIDMFHLKRNIGRGLTYGLLTFIIPLAGGAAAGHYCLGLDWVASMLVAAMFAAHTLIGYPIITRFGLTKAPAVIIAIAGTIITVLLSLIVVAAVSGVYEAGEFAISSTLQLLGRLALFSIGVYYIYPRLTRWFFKTHADGIPQFVYVLTMAFMAATLAKVIGLESVFGAFLAGLVLNRFIPGRSSLMRHIEFAGNAMFIPFFLIGVGMLINVGVLTSGWDTLYVAAVMTLAAMACKWIAAFAAQVIFGMGRIDRSIMYQLSNAHTAVALAVVMIGFNLGVFNEAILNGTILMILATCTVASVGVERAATRLVLRGRDDGDDRNSARREEPSNHTLIAVSTPATAKPLVDLALLMSAKAKRGHESKIYALHVRNDNSPSSRAIGRNTLDLAEQAAVATDTRLIPIERFDINVVTGILNVISERDISNIIIGLHRRSGVIDSFYGSKIEQLLRTTNRMVVISRVFIPLNTLTRIIVVVPPKAEYETGFNQWVKATGNLTLQAGCSIEYKCMPSSRNAIESVIRHARLDIEYSISEMERPDDYVLMANKVEDDDLLIFISARRTSISFSAEIDDMTSFIQRYFADNNLIVLYPEQFGDAPDIPTMAETMSPDIISSPLPLWNKLLSLLRRRR